MDTNSTTEVLPAPPSLMNALMAGFDAVTSHISLILLPIILDLLLWLGPRLRVDGVILPALEQTSKNIPSIVNADDWAKALTEITKFFSERFNLFTLLRTYPVGIPSLMSSRFPSQSPGAGPMVWQSEVGMLFLLEVLGMLLAGLILGAFYFSSVSQFTLFKGSSWSSALKELPNASRQVLVLSLFWLFLFLAVSLPVSCVVSSFTSGGSTIGKIGIMLYGGLLLWLAFPLVLSPHGIFVHRDSALASIRRSVKITRMTLPSTSLLFLLILLISQGMDVIWSSSKDTSWLSLVGIAGHAFVTTGLLAASFIYYKEADQWVQLTLARLKLNPPKFKV